MHKFTTLVQLVVRQRHFCKILFFNAAKWEVNRCPPLRTQSWGIMLLLKRWSDGQIPVLEITLFLQLQRSFLD